MSKKKWGKLAMTPNGKGLGEEVGNVCGARYMVHGEQALPYSILNPIQSHIDRLWLFGPDRSGSEPNSTKIIDKERGGGLGVPVIRQYRPKVTGYLHARESRSVLTLRGRRNYNRDTGRKLVKRGVRCVRRSGWIGRGDGAEVERASGYGSGVGSREVGAVCYTGQNHSGGADHTGVVWVGTGIRE
jgi:hypothetical protein